MLQRRKHSSLRLSAAVDNQSNDHKLQSWISIGALILVALLYCSSALLAPFWSDNDTWSNLLPIIHFRHSILDQHTLPLFTDLWYGGWRQWANPLWSFLYLPSTLVWLVTPLDWGARIVFLGHLIFALLVGRKLAALFLETEIERFSAAIVFTSPIFPALAAGHVEKIMAWGWVLSALFMLFNSRWTHVQRGLGTGVCLGIIPLTGANYYTLYAGILLLPLVLSYRNRRLVVFFLLGALIGLLHLPSVWHMVGYTRIEAEFYVKAYSVGLLSTISALATGLSKPLSSETWTPIGIPMLYLFGRSLFQRFAQRFSKHKLVLSPQEKSLLISIFGLFLLATGIVYRGHNLLDSFRVPARALAFVALGIAVFVFLNAREMVAGGGIKRTAFNVLLFFSSVQILISVWFIRPVGSMHSPYEKSVQELADILRDDHARSVWFVTKDLSDMYIYVGLNQKSIALPNVYYGDMGQTIEIEGNSCGYSFDHLLTLAPVEGPVYYLTSGIGWSPAKGEIPRGSLSLIKRVNLDEKRVYVYRVICQQ
jgi:hypothetical protein